MFLTSNTSNKNFIRREDLVLVFWMLTFINVKTIALMLLLLISLLNCILINIHQNYLILLAKYCKSIFFTFVITFKWDFITVWFTDLKILGYPSQYSFLVLGERIRVYTRVQKVINMIVILHLLPA